MRVRVDIVPEYRDLLAACGLDRAETLLRRPADESLVARHGKRCTEVVHPDGEDGRQALFVKRWFRRPFRDALCDLLMLRWPRCAAKVERAALASLAAAGIRAPRWAALAAERRILPGTNALVLLGEPNVRTLDEVVADDWPHLDREARRALIHRVAGAVAGLHRAGFCHRDLYTKHVLLRADGGDEVIFLDVTRLKRRWRITVAQRARDLAALDVSTSRRLVSRTDRIRWLRRYLGVERLDGRARQLVRRAMTIRRRRARRRALKVYQ